MPVTDAVNPDISKREQLLKDFDRALAEANAPVRSDGPGLLKIAGLVVKQIFNLGSRRPLEESSNSAPSNEPR